MRPSRRNGGGSNCNNGRNNVSNGNGNDDSDNNDAKADAKDRALTTATRVTLPGCALRLENARKKLDENKLHYPPTVLYHCRCTHSSHHQHCNHSHHCKAHHGHIVLVGAVDALSLFALALLRLLSL
jgi:hypothetical protein